jgi:2-keto-4-pentenoate hydratase/2-oxohepta-3-ene-1,7-dioic acid hydratase in catechol pathway
MSRATRPWSTSAADSHQKGQFLAAGDVVSVTVAGIGTLTNTLGAPDDEQQPVAG